MKRAALLALVACSGAHAATPPASHASTTPLAAVLASSLCPEVEGRTFALASGTDGVLDTYVLVKRCRARVSRDELGVAADAYAWIAVDRD
ncbi:MAG TPA: hypothetical protein VIF62_34985, partial [Labilithrix sp.]